MAQRWNSWGIKDLELDPKVIGFRSALTVNPDLDLFFPRPRAMETIKRVNGWTVRQVNLELTAFNNCFLSTVNLSSFDNPNLQSRYKQIRKTRLWETKNRLMKKFSFCRTHWAVCRRLGPWGAGGGQCQCCNLRYTGGSSTTAANCIESVG